MSLDSHVPAGSYREFVPAKQARRTQAERTEATTTALVDAARELFAHDGYAATSLDAVAAKARVTKGAVYHHFQGKPQLFEAVFGREVERLCAALPAVYASKRDPWDAFEACCRAFLEECLEPGLQRIMLLDALAAMGWEGVRRMEAPMMELMEIGIAGSGAGGADSATARRSPRRLPLRRALRDIDEHCSRRQPEGGPPQGAHRTQPSAGRPTARLIAANFHSPM